MQQYNALGQDLENTRNQYELLHQANDRSSRRTTPSSRSTLVWCAATASCAIGTTKPSPWRTPSSRSLSINKSKVKDTSGKRDIIPVYTGDWPPEIREHKLALAMVRLAEHRWATESGPAPVG